MRIIGCSKCGMKVIASSEGLCPSCRNNLLGSDSDGQVAESVAINSTEAEAENRHLEPTHFDLFWILFSLQGRLSLGMMWISTA